MFQHFSCFVVCILALTAPTAKAEEGLFINVDCSIFFYTHPIPAGQAGETIDRYIDVYAAAGAKTLLCNVNAQRTNYRSEVWDAFWDGYNPDGPDDQPFLKSVPRDQVSNYRRMIGGMLEVHKQGIDYPARVMQRCRFRGISPWITVRMNDCHNVENPDHPIHAMFWKTNPQFRVNNVPGHFFRCLDYAHPAVRDHYKALIVEILDRYDFDGLELDFMREPFLFSRGKEVEGSEILTEWLRGVRKLVDAAAERRGHPIRLGVRVPSRPETAKALGLDAVTWVKDRLVDLVVPTPRWATIEFDIPIGEWRTLLGQSDVTLAGGLEVLYRPHRGWSWKPVTPELAAGAAAVALQRGADAVYLFNYFPEGHPGWSRPVYLSTLKAMNSLEELIKLPRSVGLTYRDIRTREEQYNPPLPAKGKQISLSIDPGPIPKGEWKCILNIAEKASKETKLSRPAVQVNDRPSLFIKVREEEGLRIYSYRIPDSALAVGKSQKIVIIGDGRSTTIDRLEIMFRL